MDNIEKEIVELILQHSITKLVMGPAADRRYSRPAGTTPSPSPLDSPIIITGQPEQSGNRKFPKSARQSGGAKNVVQNLFRGAISSTTHTTRERAPSSLPKSQSEKEGLTNPADDPLGGPSFHIGETSMTRTLSSDCSQSSDGLFGLPISTSAPNLRDYRSDEEIEEELRILREQKSKLESQIADLDRMVAELVEKEVLSAGQQLVVIQKEIDALQKLRKEREEEFAREAKERKRRRVCKLAEAPTVLLSVLYLRNWVSNFELQPINDNRRRGFRNRLHPQNSEGQSSSDLQREDGTLPLPWKTRMRIAKEICSALIFLHRNEPQIVHGNLKPSNILLDFNFVSKLGDFGIANFITHDEENSCYTTTLFCIADIKGTIAYIDPEFLATGVLTAKADAYSFGVQFALDHGTLDSMLDASAGDWPLDQAKQLAQMALRCCEMSRKNRPNLELEVWKLLLLLD
ncbi:hypothetical protein NE237_005776 [Protea cynaroides]|uniref:RING-type E3 ubiquitin transferase n=1 Tax=Protea cynaroides TaxID=273540 RepID=A0A9Q0KL85_9MAGN|nr:hypothetical protein NE237_005776 [Protea cynaroides]